MARCIDEGCRCEIEDRYCFCPYCGTDNRAPEARDPVGGHDHSFPGENCLYCVRCGELSDDVAGKGRTWRIRTAVGKILACVLMGALGLWVRILTVSPEAATPFAKWCQARWYQPSPGHDGDLLSRHGGIVSAVLIVVALVWAPIPLIQLFCRPAWPPELMDSANREPDSQP
jgi:hypothetical protein